MAHPDDAAYAMSVLEVRRDGQQRRWSILGWAGASALLACFTLSIGPGAAAPASLHRPGIVMMSCAALALALGLGAQARNAVRVLPQTLHARRIREAARRAARADPALVESARDIDRARRIRAVGLAGFGILCVVISRRLGTVDIGHHSLRGLEGMPTAGLFAAMTAVGCAAVVAVPLVLTGRQILISLGRGPEEEAIDATGLIDEAWDVLLLDQDRDMEGPPTARRAAHLPHTPAHGPHHDGSE